MTILECVRLAKEAAIKQANEPQEFVREIYLSGPMAIKAWALGVLNPHDQSVRVIIPGQDLPLVQEYLKSIGAME